MSLLYVSYRRCASATLSIQEESPLFSGTLAVLSTFIMGASAGALLMHIKYKSLLHDCRKALEANLGGVFHNGEVVDI